MITRVCLHAGEGPGRAGLSLRAAPLTVFVGPNNSGKSLALRELQLALNGTKGLKLIADVETARFDSPGELEAAIASGAIHQNDEVYSFIGADQSSSLRKGQFDTLSRNEVSVKGALYSAFGVRLDGGMRLSITVDRQLVAMSSAPASILDVIVRDEGLRKRLREITKDAFDKYFVVDTTAPGLARVRLSDALPSDIYEEQAFDQRAQDFHRAANLLAEFSDGVRAYVGIFMFLLGGRHRIILIDEPDAFLHPPLARKLGARVAKIADERKANVFVATHSSDFVIGALSSGVDVQIVRLTYAHGEATARSLPSEDLRMMFRSALMRSGNALSALFHQGAMVTEAAGDSAFYDEINLRLLDAGDEGAESCLFLNAQNKDTVGRMIGPLRKLGVPAAAIVDIDILKNGGTAWTNLMAAAGMPKALAESTGQLRSKVLDAFKSSGREMKREGGIELLLGDLREACGELFRQLARYGVFVVPNGELQSWLPQFGVTKESSTPWLLKMQAQLRSDPKDPAYVKPGPDDVWEFVRSIARWMKDPRRLGMHAESHLQGDV